MAEMTGKEIMAEEFERAGMLGYKAEQVDAFLQRVADYVDQSNQEREDLSYKIQILADKIEEYKADEENIRDALLGAQKMGTSILNESKSKAETLLRDSKAQAEEMLVQAHAKVDALTKESLQKANSELNSIKRECDMQQRHLEALKQEVSSFRASLLKQYKTHLNLLTNLPSLEKEEKNTAAVEAEPEKRLDSVNEVKPEPRYPLKDEVETVQADSAFKTASSEETLPHMETIPGDYSLASEALTSEMEADEREQTKEFAGAILTAKPEEEEPQEEQAVHTPSRKRPYYIEKFGELHFGEFDNDKK